MKELAGSSMCVSDEASFAYCSALACADIFENPPSDDHMLDLGDSLPESARIAVVNPAHVGDLLSRLFGGGDDLDFADDDAD